MGQAELMKISSVSQFPRQWCWGMNRRGRIRGPFLRPDVDTIPIFFWEGTQNNELMVESLTSAAEASASKKEGDN